MRRNEMTNLSRSVYACCQNGSFDLPNKLFSETRDRIRDRVRIEIVVQRVVADAGVQADFEVVRLATGGGEHAAHLPQKSPLTSSTRPPTF